MEEPELRSLMEMYDQEWVLAHFEKLTSREKAIFLKNCDDLDFRLVYSLFNQKKQQDPSPIFPGAIQPANIIHIPKTTGEKERETIARRSGENLLREGKVAVLIVAGGQGSRLGFEGPKGTYPISPVTGKSFFQIFAEQVSALRARYGAPIPLLIMTSQQNHLETERFFQSHRFFGLSAETVLFFEQGRLPSITPDGQLILKDNTAFFTNPDGHGGSLKALFTTGLLEELIDGGFTTLFYCQVDNPLVKIADPSFTGHHFLAGAQISTKVVRRTDTSEKVGIYLNRGGRDTIVEYSELGDRDMHALDEEGGILYWAGNTAIHVIDLQFIKKLNSSGFALPYHCAEKEVRGFSISGKKATMKGWKFETFVFDAIPFAGKACSVEAAREEEFSPVKNASGADSPETAIKAMNIFYRKKLENLGYKVTPGRNIEIHPHLVIFTDELAKKLKKTGILPEGDLYIS